MHIAILKVVGKNAITLKDGQKIFESVAPVLSAGQTVHLDFAGVEVFASPFFNAAIGQLLSTMTPTALNTLLRLQNLPDIGRRTLRDVIKNAKEYFAKDAAGRAALDAIAEHSAS